MLFNSSWEKSCPLGFPRVLFAVLIACVPFPLGFVGQDVELDCISSWSLHFHLLCLCVSRLIH